MFGEKFPNSFVGAFQWLDWAFIFPVLGLSYPVDVFFYDFGRVSRDHQVIFRKFFNDDTSGADYTVRADFRVFKNYCAHSDPDVVSDYYLLGMVGNFSGFVYDVMRIVVTDCNVGSQHAIFAEDYFAAF